MLDAKLEAALVALALGGFLACSSTPKESTGTGSSAVAASGSDIAAGSSATTPPPAKDAAPMTLKDHDYERGPSIYPADQLLAWLEKQRTDIGEIVVRLPVQCTLKPNKMNLAKATVGDAADALAIKVNDISLGLPVAAKMQQLCEGKDTCMLWLRGVWRGGEIKEFQISRVDGVVEDAAQATYAEVAKK